MVRPIAILQNIPRTLDRRTGKRYHSLTLYKNDTFSLCIAHDGSQASHSTRADLSVRQEQKRILVTALCTKILMGGHLSPLWLPLLSKLTPGGLQSSTLLIALLETHAERASKHTSPKEVLIPHTFSIAPVFPRSFHREVILVPILSRSCPCCESIF